MKKTELSEAVGMLANFGVIASIVFLAVEVRQNNDQLAAQTRNTIFEARSGLERDYYNNVGGIVDLVVKYRHGETLTEVEEARLQSRRFNLLRTFEYMVQESPDTARTQAGYMVGMFRQDPTLMAMYQMLDPEFIEFAETNVFPLLRQAESTDLLRD